MLASARRTRDISDAPGQQGSGSGQRGRTPQGQDARLHGVNNPNDDIRIPDHKVIGVLGQGGMARVFLARDEAFDRLVAVKVIDIFGNDTMTLVPVNVG